MQHVKNNPKVQILLAKTDEFLAKIGYTDHGIRHAEIVSKSAMRILRELGYPLREQKLAEIAGYLHDVGNSINRVNHAQTGALLVNKVLCDMDFDYVDIMDICGSIGNHHEEEGRPVSNIAAALIIADKTDVHRSRVRKDADIKLDIHDRVNYAVEESNLEIGDKTLALNLKVDNNVSSVMEYFEIFMDRMIMSCKAAEYLGCKFELYVNGNKII